jgi:CCR4-NOT complex subunit CAF16
VFLHRQTPRVRQLSSISSTHTSCCLLLLCLLSPRAAYPNHETLLSCDSLTLPAGSRCLLCGANGSGKSTLLQVLGGKTLVPQDAVRVLGEPPFHTLQLTCGGDLSYLGSHWRRTVASAGYDIPLGGDIRAGTMIRNVEGVEPQRRDTLMELLDIDEDWSMMHVSDGQRRRVQICLGLLKPYKVLLCDEITVDLDVCARLDLLDFLRRETEERGATVVYATHIIDGLEHWPTHVAYMQDGRLMRAGPAAEAAPEMLGPDDADGNSAMIGTLRSWLLAERDERLARGGGVLAGKPIAGSSGSPFFSSKHMSHFR